MRAFVQRVTQASVAVAKEDYERSIQQGFLIFFGVSAFDTEEDYQFILRKIKSLRIFSDEDGKMNLSLKQVNGEILLVSQFTLYGSVKNNNRPSFTNSANPTMATMYYERLISDLSLEYTVKTGIFGADMKVSILNDGPVSILIDSKEA